MRTETLQKGVLALTAAFPTLNFNAKLYREMLGDIDDRFFLQAVCEFLKTVKEIYPGTNPIAVLRELANEFKKAQLQKTPKITGPVECAPPPKEWYEAKRKLENKFGVKTMI